MIVNIWNGVLLTISLIGFIANIMSISYFIKNEKHGLVNKLMISLNFTDALSIFIWISFSITNFMYYSNNRLAESYLLWILEQVEFYAVYAFNSTCTISGCLTFGLTLLRTIAIYNPFYQMKLKMYMTCLVFIVVVLVILMQTLAFWTDTLSGNLTKYVRCGVIIAILSCCNILMSVATIILLKKTRGDGQQERNHAAVTMVIVSLIYFITSIPVLITILILHNDYFYLHEIYFYAFMFLLSCFLNPIVYFFRKRQMQHYVKEQFHKLVCC